MKKIFSICLVLLTLHTLAVERTIAIPGIFTISGKIIPQGEHPRNRIIEFRLNDLLSSDSRKYIANIDDSAQFNIEIPVHFIQDFYINYSFLHTLIDKNGKIVHKNALRPSDGQKTIRAIEQLLN